MGWLLHITDARATQATAAHCPRYPIALVYSPCEPGRLSTRYSVPSTQHPAPNHARYSTLRLAKGRLATFNGDGDEFRIQRLRGFNPNRRKVYDKRGVRIPLTPSGLGVCGSLAFRTLVRILGRHTSNSKRISGHLMGKGIVIFIDHRSWVHQPWEADLY